MLKIKELGSVYTQEFIKSGGKESAMEKPPLLDDVRRVLRTRHYSIRTEQAYVHWIKRFIAIP